MKTDLYRFSLYSPDHRSALLALCVGNSPVTGEFPSQRPVTRSFDVFFDLRLNKRLSKQWWGCWFETLSRSLWRHCNVSCCFCHGGFQRRLRLYTYPRHCLFNVSVAPVTMSSEGDYVCTLTEASLEKAKKELNEDPNTRMEAVETLRTWVKQQPHFRCRTGMILYRMHCVEWSKMYLSILNIKMT